MKNWRRILNPEATKKKKKDLKKYKFPGHKMVGYYYTNPQGRTQEIE